MNRYCIVTWQFLEIWKWPDHGIKHALTKKSSRRLGTLYPITVRFRSVTQVKKVQVTIPNPRTQTHKRPHTIHTYTENAKPTI